MNELNRTITHICHKAKIEVNTNLNEKPFLCQMYIYRDNEWKYNGYKQHSTINDAVLFRDTWLSRQLEPYDYSDAKALGN